MQFLSLFMEEYTSRILSSHEFELLIQLVTQGPLMSCAVALAADGQGKEGKLPYVIGMHRYF